ncbi:MAG: Ig-like domain-containing protein [Deltaproteobacteria bacterium]|nr:Ig-like domain-containing protein [Deltaproteobacteria bacterium]
MRSASMLWGFLSVGLALTLGCGGGDTGGAGTLQLVQTVPADMATDVPTDVVVTAELDSALNEATVTTSSFTLTRDGGADVEGSVAVDGETASYTPSRPLGLLSSYTATLTTAIESISGATLETSETWTFSTEDGQWGEPVLIEISNAGGARFPQVALDPTGNAVAVWEQSDGSRDNIWANRFTPSAGWGVADRIETASAGGASRPQVAVDPTGNAVAVWEQWDGARRNIWANRFTPSSGWGVAGLIETDNAGTAARAQVAVDPLGNAVAVWEQSDGTRFNIWANRFTPSAGWGVAEPIETDDVGSAVRPQVALDPNGNAVAVWSRDNVWANRFTPTAGWGVAERIETDNAGGASASQVALDPNGNAVAVWEQYDGTRTNIWANRFTPAAGWGVAERIETDNAKGAFSPQVALDPNGNAVAVWSQDDGTRVNIWANRFSPTAGWGVAERIETDNAGGASASQVALDPNGNAVAVWEQYDGTRTNIWANRFSPTAGWGVAERIETDDAGGAESAQVALDPNGNAVAVWEQSDGTRVNIWANRFE